MSSRSPAIPNVSVVSHTDTNMPPPTTPTNGIQHKHRCNQANFSSTSTHPSFHPIHPSILTSKEDGAADAALASAAPPLKGHTCSLLWAAVHRWNDRWHQKIYVREEKTELSSRAVALDSVFIYCRSALLQPSLYFAWQHWVARACAVGADMSVTWPAADCTATDRMKRTWLWLFARISLFVFASDERIMHWVCLLTSNVYCKMLQGS